MRRPDVSIIVPAFNSENFLGECLDSLLGQTLENVEVIVIDDCSTDGTLDIARRYEKSDGRIRVFQLAKNCGQGVARNLGIKHAAGEYLGFMDSDDVAHPSMYEVMIEAVRGLGADCCSCGLRNFKDSGSGRIFSKRVMHPNPSCGREGQLLSPQVQPPIHLWRAELIKGSGASFPESRGSEDIGFFLEAAICSKSFVAVDTPLVFRRIRANSTSRGISENFCLQVFSVFDHVWDFCKNSNIAGADIELIDAVMIRMLLGSRLACVGGVEDREAQKRLIKRAMDYINSRCGSRTKNRYLTGARGLYLKHSGVMTMRLLAPILYRRYERLLDVE